MRPVLLGEGPRQTPLDAVGPCQPHRQVEHAVDAGGEVRRLEPRLIEQRLIVEEGNDGHPSFERQRDDPAVQAPRFDRLGVPLLEVELVSGDEPVQGTYELAQRESVRLGERRERVQDVADGAGGGEGVDLFGVVASLKVGSGRDAGVGGLECGEPHGPHLVLRSIPRDYRQNHVLPGRRRWRRASTEELRVTGSQGQARHTARRAGEEPPAARATVARW